MSEDQRKHLELIQAVMRQLPGLRTVIIACFIVATQAKAQPSAPPLAELKAAAENGNAKAQDKLGDIYRSRGETDNALIWYRKAAEQGVENSQYYLARIMVGYAKSPLAKPETSAANAEEGIKWYLKLANQGMKHAQFDLGREYEQGRIVKKDYVEAYKWFALASEGEKLPGAIALEAKWALDGVILKMSQEQIAEGQKRVSAFVPHHVAKDDLPEPAWVKQIKLQGISGTKRRRLAIINGQTFGRGDESKLKVGTETVKISCIEVREASVRVFIEGLEGERELKLTSE